MSKIEFVGKCLLIKEREKRILVIGDLHLGYEGSLRKRGAFIERGLFKENLEYLDNVFGKVGRVEEVVLLGDVKHEFGRIVRQEWKDVLGLIDYLEEKCGKIIIVKGNHDKVIRGIARQRDVEVKDFYIVGENCFLHGDRDFPEIYDKKIKRWVMGHGHPAIKLREPGGVKMEKFKCYLVGKFKGKEIVVVPSFFEGNEGSDVRENDLRLAWNFKLNSFKVMVVQEDSLDVLDFGELRGM